MKTLHAGKIGLVVLSACFLFAVSCDSSGGDGEPDVLVVNDGSADDDMIQTQDVPQVEDVPIVEDVPLVEDVPMVADVPLVADVPEPDDTEEPPLECQAPGDPCDPSDLMNGDYSCVEDEEGSSEGTCYERCNYNAEQEQCPAGSVCVDFSDGQYYFGVCVMSDCTDIFHSVEDCGDVGANGGTCTPFNNGAFFCAEAGVADVGEDCSDEDGAGELDICRPGLLCLDSLCTEPCEVGGDDCVAPQTCFEAFDGHSVMGLCYETCGSFSMDECSVEGEGCLTVSETEGICVEMGSLMEGEACGDAVEDSCGEGLICLLTSDVAGECVAYCNPNGEAGDPGLCPEDGQSCEPLSRDYLGLCEFKCTMFSFGECPDGMGCFPTSGDEGVCIEVGILEAGAPCGELEEDSCGEGLLCLYDSDTGGTCTPFCNPNFADGDLLGACPNETELCETLSVAYFGACFQTCQPWGGMGDECGDAMGCFPNEEGPGTCVSVGNTAVGELCSPPYAYASCEAGALCLPDYEGCYDLETAGDCAEDGACVWEDDSCGPAGGTCRQLCLPFVEGAGDCSAGEFCEIFTTWFGDCRPEDELLGLAPSDDCAASQQGDWCDSESMCIQVTSFPPVYQCGQLCRTGEYADCPAEQSCEAVFSSEALGMCQ